MNLTRRGLLIGVGAASVSIAGVVGLGLLPPRPREARTPLQSLSPGAFAILAAVADRLCPGGPTLPGAWELEVPEKLDAFFMRTHPSTAAEFSQALWLVENPLAGTLLDQRAARFTESTADEQDRSLEAWRTSSWPLRRQAFHALNGLVQATYWADPRTWPHMGYAGPPTFGGTP